MIKPNLSIITGASRGIGYALALELAKQGVNLILTARDRESLEKIKENFEKSFKIDVFIINQDLTCSNSYENIEQFLIEKELYPDMLINNAGIGLYGKFSASDLTITNDVIMVNINSTVALCRLFLRRVEADKESCILNVSSSFAYRQSPNWSVYGAAKSFIYSFSKSLALEYKDSKVQVSVLCPGKTDTNFDNISGYFPTGNRMKHSTHFVAEYAIKQLQKQRSIIIPGYLNKFQYLFFKLCPQFISDGILKRWFSR